MEANGVPLSEWGVEIYRGILTGCNDVFVISGETKDAILASCLTEEERIRTAEIIRPILRGRNIKKYRCEWADEWIVGTFPSRKYNIDDYPALKNYLLSFGMEALEQSGKTHIINGVPVKSRKKTNNKWFETQDSIAYWDNFSQPKIVWGEISDKSKFYLDNSDGFYCEATTFLMTGDELWYILACINSNLIEQYFTNIGTTTGEGTVRWKKYKVLDIPVPKTTNTQLKDKIVALAKEIQNQSRVGKDCSNIENLLESYVLEAYQIQGQG